MQIVEAESSTLTLGTGFTASSLLPLFHEKMLRIELLRLVRGLMRGLMVCLLRIVFVLNESGAEKESHQFLDVTEERGVSTSQVVAVVSLGCDTAAVFADARVDDGDVG